MAMVDTFLGGIADEGPRVCWNIPGLKLCCFGDSPMKGSYFRLHVCASAVYLRSLMGRMVLPQEK